MSLDWNLYKRLPGFVLGFHGCDERTGEAVLGGKVSLKKSENEYDWLGSGWARSSIPVTASMDSCSLAEMKSAHDLVSTAWRLTQTKPPENKGGPDKRARFLDRAVIEAMHKIRRDESLVAYDTVRSAF